MYNFKSCFIIGIILILLFGCREMKPQEEKNEAEKKTVIQQTCEIGTIVYDYNPRKAGAKIVRRVDAPKGYYVTRTNGHYYMITADKIIIFDIRYNKMKIIREIPYQLEQLCKRAF